ncbi:MAG: hypothetical protein KKC75_05800 [Nanoarchaeota archaeon]|nr:hypothetical protein [Nanoarchaeota archaeon]MBU1004910.1 hypothetical protein [Nanoarchaeota archaeon]MBU1945644.1 hypothetical protein [Nanoarchaeota archaeon]
MHKKAAMELSVTAIVVLILAIVMLGLGLGFIRGMFGKVSTQLEQQVAAEPEPSAPTGAFPITLSRESLITHAGDKEIIKVGLYNPSNESWLTISPTISCTPPLNGITVDANPKNVEQGQSVIFNLLSTIPSSAPNTYLCQVQIERADATTIPNYEKDFTIKIVQ